MTWDNPVRTGTAWPWWREERPQRAAVQRAALRWLRTPYHHNARLIGVGVDCARFPIEVYVRVGVIPPYDPGFYPPQWGLHRDAEIYIDQVLLFGAEVETAEEAGPGGFMAWRFGRTYSHGAILLEGTTVIHAVIGRGVELADRVRDEELASRPARFFSMWGGHGR